jgi:hypothetical protein
MTGAFEISLHFHVQISSMTHTVSYPVDISGQWFLLLEYRQLKCEADHSPMKGWEYMAIYLHFPIHLHRNIDTLPFHFCDGVIFMVSLIQFSQKLT